MAYSHIWYHSEMPQDLIDIMCRELSKFDVDMEESVILSTEMNTVTDFKIRSSKNTWIKGYHWIHGLVWHYINLANRTNFLYDIENIDGYSVQYSTYFPGNFYTWHSDSNIDDSYKPINERALMSNIAQDQVNVLGESSRKLSFSLQLSDESEYDGGELQLMSSAGNIFTMPKQKGSMIIFDSRLTHRVRKVKSGIRKSLVGWAVGPRWR